jgi:opacity protein-like surface antigen
MRPRFSLSRPAVRRCFDVTAALAAFALVACLPATLLAQSSPPPSGRISAGGAINVMQPRGEFDEATGFGGGLGGNVVFRLEETGILNFRADVSFMNNGNVRRRLPLSSTIGNLIQVDLNTSNNVGTFLVGPQLLGPNGAFSPYAAALVGFSGFWTTSSVEGSDNTQSFASTTNSSDFAWAYGGTAGAYLRLRGGDRPLHLDLGVRLLRHDDVTYLTAREVREAIDAGRDPRPIRSRADYLTYFVGVQAWVF